MIKKIALGALLTGLVAALIVGAVIRTNAKSADGAGETGRRGQSTEYAATAANGEETGNRGAGGQGGRGESSARWVENDQVATGRGGGWAQGGAGNQGSAASPAPEADIRPEDWVSVQGTVVSVADNLIEIRTAGGEVVPFEGRPLSYALEQGLGLSVGDAVTLTGFDEDGEFKIGQVTSNGVSITLRDTGGRPGWAGGSLGGRGEGSARGVENDEVSTGRGGGWAQGGAGNQGSAVSPAPEADIQPEDWISVQGSVVSVTGDLIEIRTAGGEIIPFEGRPLSYALEQGLSLSVGDAVTLTGFDEDGEFKIGQVTSNGVSITLRDTGGRPGWAGGSRRGSAQS